MMNGETVTAAAASIGVDRGAIYVWKRDRPDLDAAFEAARLAGAEMIAQDALRIVDGDDLDDLVPMDLEGVRGLVNRKTQLAAAGGDPVARARLRFEGRMKLLAKWFPQHYGDKLLHAGHDGGAIKSETALSVKELAQQLRARASGLVIEGDAKELLTDETERFNGTSVSNEGDAQCAPTEFNRSARPTGQRLTNTSDTTEILSQPTQPASRASSGAARATAPAQHASGPKAEGNEGAGLRAGAAERGTVSAGEAGGKRRSRGVGDRGGALKRGASGETGGTPAPQISEISQSVSETERLAFPADDDWDPEDYV